MGLKKDKKLVGKKRSFKDVIDDLLQEIKVISDSSTTEENLSMN